MRNTFLQFRSYPVCDILLEQPDVLRHCMIPFIGKVQNRNKEQMSGCLGLGGGDSRMTNGVSVGFLLGVEDEDRVLKFTVVAVAQL